MLFLVDTKLKNQLKTVIDTEKDIYSYINKFNHQNYYLNTSENKIFPFSKFLIPHSIL